MMINPSKITKVIEPEIFKQRLKFFRYIEDRKIKPFITYDLGDKLNYYLENVLIFIPVKRIGRGRGRVSGCLASI